MSTTISTLPMRHVRLHGLGISLHDDGQVLVLRPAAHDDPELTSETDLPWLIHRHAKPLVVDLAGLEQFNSDVARWLLQLIALLPSQRLHLRNTSRSVHAGLRLLGFDRLVDAGQ